MSSEELRKVEQRARDEVMLELVDVVDDCDRAMDLIYSASDREPIAKGIRQMRTRLLRRFEAAGLRSYGTEGEEFDPHRHQAIATEPCHGPDNRIIKVHRRGWINEQGRVLRAAVVTVCKGTPEGPAPEPAPAPADEAYRCPYGTPGCEGDCPSCKLAEAGGGVK